ncbi:MAG: hypothetical protein ACLTPN_02710 [Clostridia bacterium]|jgi:hypothetical protein
MAEKKYLNDDGLSYLWLKLKQLFAGKVDKIEGKGLSDRNFTQAMETKLNGLQNYTLPKASAETLGGVKVGAGLQISNEGTLSTTGGGIADAVAWENVTNKPTTLAGYGITDVKISGKVITLGTSSITVPSKTSEITNDSGFITKIPIASNSVLGGIKVGANLSVSSDGILSAEKVPTKVSELQNDSNFLTSVPIASATTAGIIKVGTNLSISNGVLSVTGIPTKVSQLTNDSKFQTDTQVQSSINNAISGITSFDYQIVSQLPQSGKKGTIYLVSKSGSGKDVYDEYIWVTDKFELIGTTAVDLTGYVKNTDLVAISNDEIDQILAS